MALVEEQGEVGTLDRLIHVCIGKYNVRAFAAEFECDALQVRLRGGLHDQVPNLGRAREGDFVHVHVARDRLAGSRTVAGQDVHHSFRETCLDDQFTDAKRRQRGLLSGLEHDDVAARQGGPELPGLHEQRKVPRDDLTDYADRLEAGIAEVVPVDRDGAPMHFVRPSSVVAVARNRERQVGSERDAIRFAVVEAFQAGQLVRVFFDQVGQSVHQLSTFGSRHFAPRPLLEGLAGRLYRSIHILLVGCSDLADFFTRGRVNRGKGLAGGRLRPPVVDEKFVRRDRDSPLRRECGCRHGTLLLSPPLRGSRDDSVSICTAIVKGNADRG